MYFRARDLLSRGEILLPSERNRITCPDRHSFASAWLMLDLSDVGAAFDL